jgi:hypothetical protein
MKRQSLLIVMTVVLALAGCAGQRQAGKAAGTPPKTPAQIVITSRGPDHFYATPETLRVEQGRMVEWVVKGSPVRLRSVEGDCICVLGLNTKLTPGTPIGMEAVARGHCRFEVSAHEGRQFLNLSVVIIVE